MPRSAEPLPDLPPIILLVDETGVSVPLYAARLESAGLWVSCLTDPAEALATAQDLRPDVIVTDVQYGEGTPGWGLFASLNTCDTTSDIPLIALTTPAAPVLPAPVRARKTRCLIKPVPADALLADVQQLLVQEYAFRIRAARDREGLRALQGRSESLIVRPASPSDHPVRCCPGCNHPLEWIDQGRIASATFDYYQWCVNGCGLFCYDVDGEGWERLAGGSPIAAPARSATVTTPAQRSDIGLMTDRAGCIVAIDAAGAKLLNFSARHAVGTSILPFIQEQRAEIFEDLRRAGIVASPPRAVTFRPRERRPRPATVSVQETEDGIRWIVRPEPVPPLPPRHPRK
jgi:FixJ family two-component response regulator